MFLIDTSVTSEPAKPRPDSRVVDWLRDTPRPQLFISVITVGEHRHGIERIAERERRAFLEGYVERLLLDFRGRILPVTIDVADHWGRLSAANSLTGRVIEVADSLIAATALAHGLTVVTRNTRHFEDLGLPVLNPWEPQPDPD